MESKLKIIKDHLKLLESVIIVEYHDKNFLVSPKQVNKYKRELVNHIKNLVTELEEKENIPGMKSKMEGYAIGDKVTIYYIDEFFTGVIEEMRPSSITLKLEKESLVFQLDSIGSITN